MPTVAQWAEYDDAQLDPNQLWQAHLWRALRADVGPVLAQASRASVHRRFIDALNAQLAEGRVPVGLPRRVPVFGVSLLSANAVEALATLGQACQVRLLVQSPCRHDWDNGLPRRSKEKDSVVPAG